MVAAGTAGQVILTGSWVGSVPWPEIAAYSASKAGLQMLARSAARELAPYGIRVNVIAPGIVRAGMAKHQYDNEPQYRARVGTVIPLGEMQTVEQVGAVTGFLCSSAADYLTGSVLLADGVVRCSSSTADRMGASQVRDGGAGASAGAAVVAVDVGGTGIKCAIVDATGAVHHTERHPTGAERGPLAVLDTILDVTEGLARRARTSGLVPCGVGVAVPGIVDEAAGVAVWSANVGFRDVPVRDLVAERVGLPTVLGHDVRAGGLAEARLGAGVGYRQVLVVPVGTGIAAAHVVDGRGFAGAHGAAGELGHVVVRPGGPRCACGGSGCLEAVASASAIARAYSARAGVATTAEQVARRAAGGEALAGDVWADAVDALADGLLTAVAMIDPEVVVVGGGLARAGEALLDPLRAALAARVTFHRLPAIHLAALGDEAGCLGAALLALDASTSGPAGSP